MDHAQILSPKVSIDEALEFLGMSNMDKAMGIQALLRICEFDALPLFFDQHLTCVPTSINFGDQYDEAGEFIETRLVEPEDERELVSEHILDSFQLHMPTGNSYDLIVSRVIHDDVPYHLSQSDGTVSEGVSIGYEKFYFLREPLIEYKAEYTSYFSQNFKATKTRSKPTSVHEQRIAAFKYWLVGNSGKSIHEDAELQSCYESLGEPTREEVWNRLQAMDGQLFARGKDDFIKAMCSVVNFKQGTGNGRNR